MTLVANLLSIIIILFFPGVSQVLSEGTIVNDDVFLRPITSNEEFLQWLKSENLLTCGKIEDILRKVNVLTFVPPDETCFLLDIQTPIKYGAFIENPSLILTYLSIIQPHLNENSKVLEIGSGSGYLTNMISELMNSTGQVIGIEHVPQLVNSSIQNILHSNARLLTDGHIKFVVADGRKGYAKKCPYDLILMSVATPHLSSTLLDQLRPGGRLIIPLGEPDDVHTLCTIDKLENGTLHKTVITRGSFGHVQTLAEQVGSWANGTSYSEVNAEQKYKMRKLIADLGREECEMDPKEKIKDLFESAKLSKVEKKLESYERECKQAALMEDTTKFHLPFALEEVIHDLRTVRTKKTKKKRVTTISTENLLMWK
ncbi:hypothetical protein M8J76_008277 [Diaphorina citri]|nr:hypothetical protein M8J76_008277 [Diaphorina citri]